MNKIKAGLVWLRKSILHLMFNRDWHLSHAYIYTFWEWVVMPKTCGGRLGFINWLKYRRRRG